jgi:HD-GYP domain-containing protein (c-di-GMP phosphodiesterase class II)
MNINYFRPITLDSITPGHFPHVALFMLSGKNFVLYKPHDRPFTEQDRERLARNNVEMLYIRAGDMEPIADYLESSLADVLKRRDLGSAAKGKILYQTAINYVVEVFETPTKAENIERCRNLIRNIMDFVAGDKHALGSLQTLIGHNYYIFVHSVQVTAMTLLLHAELYSLDRDEILDVGIGALLHDIGMIALSNDILNKPEALTDIEYHKVKQHPQKGYDILKPVGKFNDISLNIVRHHHEKFDGSGYPGMLKGNAIPRSAQIAAICDTYSAVTTDRVYRNGMPADKALEIMRREAATAFNPDLYARFEEIVFGRELV